MYSVSEIIALDLPLLPKTKPAIMSKAKREGWRVEERITQGGASKFFEVPQAYFTGGMAPISRKISMRAAQQAAEQAFKMAQIAGVTDVDKFVEMFMTLCVTEPPEQPSMSHNARHKIKASKDSQVVVGDGNIQIGRVKDKRDETAD